MVTMRRYIEAVARSNSLADLSRWTDDELLDVVALHGDARSLDAWAARVTAVSSTPEAVDRQSREAEAFIHRARQRVAAGDPNVTITETPAAYTSENNAAGPA